MTGFWDSGDNSTAAERRQRRMAEARRRVETGENSPPPLPPAPPAKRGRTRAARNPGAAPVDPRTVPGAQFAVWRSVQHFCTTDSLPDARGADLDLLIAWSDSIQPFRLRPRIVARLDSDGTWLPVSYAKDGARELITQAQAERYRQARLEEGVLSGGAQKPLTESDHPDETVTL